MFARCNLGPIGDEIHKNQPCPLQSSRQAKCLSRMKPMAATASRVDVEWHTGLLGLAAWVESKTRSGCQILKQRFALFCYQRIYCNDTSASKTNFVQNGTLWRSMERYQWQRLRPHHESSVSYGDQNASLILWHWMAKL